MTTHGPGTRGSSPRLTTIGPGGTTVRRRVVVRLGRRGEGGGGVLQREPLGVGGPLDRRPLHEHVAQGPSAAWLGGEDRGGQGARPRTDLDHDEHGG